jgi:diacylglycerol kinase
MEMLNTVIEAVVDLASPEYHPLAQRAKDLAAGAVLMAAFASVIVGVYVFVPRLIHL